MAHPVPVLHHVVVKPKIPSDVYSGLCQALFVGLPEDDSVVVDLHVTPGTLADFVLRSVMYVRCSLLANTTVVCRVMAYKGDERLTRKMTKAEAWTLFVCGVADTLPVVVHPRASDTPPPTAPATAAAPTSPQISRAADATGVPLPDSIIAPPDVEQKGPVPLSDAIIKKQTHITVPEFDQKYPVALVIPCGKTTADTAIGYFAVRYADVARHIDPATRTLRADYLLSSENADVNTWGLWPANRRTGWGGVGRSSFDPDCGVMMSRGKLNLRAADCWWRMAKWLGALPMAKSTNVCVSEPSAILLDELGTDAETITSTKGWVVTVGGDDSGTCRLPLRDGRWVSIAWRPDGSLASPAHCAAPEPDEPVVRGEARNRTVRAAHKDDFVVIERIVGDPCATHQIVERPSHKPKLAAAGVVLSFRHASFRVLTLELVMSPARVVSRVYSTDVDDCANFVLGWPQKVSGVRYAVCALSRAPWRTNVAVLCMGDDDAPPTGGGETRSLADALPYPYKTTVYYDPARAGVAGSPTRRLLDRFRPDKDVPDAKRTRSDADAPDVRCLNIKWFMALVPERNRNSVAVVEDFDAFRAAVGRVGSFAHDRSAARQMADVELQELRRTGNADEADALEALVAAEKDCVDSVCIPVFVRED